MPGPYIFSQIFAADPANTANVATNASILLFAPGDPAMTPVVITDASTGRILANPVETNANGFGPTFAHETLDQVAWEGGGFTGTFESYRGMKDAADAAAGSATLSAAAAVTAAEEAAGAVGEALAGAVQEAEDAKVAAQAAAGLVGAPAGAAVRAAISPGGAAEAALSAAIDPKVAPKLDIIEAEATYSRRETIAEASDPVAYLDSVSLLCQFPVRENGETLWPQGLSINKAGNEIYVSNSDGPAAILRIDIRNLTTGARKSSKTITVPTGTWSQALPWFYNGNNELCFIVRATASAQANPSTYAIYNYITGTLGSNVNINGSTNADVSGDYFITSDAWVTNANVFYVYDWASIKAGTPTLLATVPIENAGTTLGKVQGVALVGSIMYLLHGGQNINPAITAYTMTGRLVATRNYSLADFQSAVNALLPGSLTNNAYIYENEGGTNLDGKLVTLQIVNNNPAVTAEGVCLVLEHNRVDGVPIKTTLAPAYVYDTGWQTITMNAGWTVSAGVPLQVRRIGSMVRLRGQVINADPAIANTYAPVGNLPAGFRPPANSLYFPCSANTTTPMSCRIDPGGGINLWASATTGAVRTVNSITYLLD